MSNVVYLSTSEDYQLFLPAAPIGGNGSFLSLIIVTSAANWIVVSDE